MLLRGPLASSPGRGVTLLESMFALVIVAVLAALAVPSFGQQVSRQRLKAAAEGMAADLAEARFEAARRGQTLHLHARQGRDWCYALSRTPGCDCGTACAIKTVRAAELPGVELQGAASARFDASGEASDAGAALWRSTHGDVLRVQIGPLGRARICVAEGTATGYPRCAG